MERTYKGTLGCCELYVDLNSKRGKELIKRYKKRFGKNATIHPIQLTDSPKGIPVFEYINKGGNPGYILVTYETIEGCLGLWVAERYFDDLTKTFSKKDKVDIGEVINYLMSKDPKINRDFILDVSKSWVEYHFDKTV